MEEPRRDVTVARGILVEILLVILLGGEEVLKGQKLHLKGREDDVINVGGFKVAPTEVEDVAMAYPKLKDCICISAEHPITGRALKLLVVMNDGELLNKRELALHLKEKLEPYKVPMLYEQVEKVARTFNGKLDRKAYTLNIKH